MLSNFRLTLRSPGKSPVFVAVFTLTFGIGVNAAMFGIVNAILLRGLPFGEPERLVAIETAKPADDQLYWPLSPLELAGFVACLVPALRAVRVNPVEALRCE